MRISDLIIKLNNESKLISLGKLNKESKLISLDTNLRAGLILSEVITDDLYGFISDYLTNSTLKEHKISGRLKTDDNPMIEVTKRVSEINGKKTPANYFKADLEVKMAYFQTGASINSRVEFNFKKVSESDDYKWFVTEITSSEITKLAPITIESYMDILVRINRYLNKIEPVIKPVI